MRRSVVYRVAAVVSTGRPVDCLDGERYCRSGMAQLQRVCSVAELPPGGRYFTSVKGHGVGVFNVNGELYAIQNRCPHQGAPLCIGALTGVLEARGPGFDFEWSRDGELIRCPWHGWEFELSSGRSLSDP